MEYNEEKKEETESESERDEDNESNGMKQWFRDNLRIIISVLIVVIIAGGIYSYSKRTEAPSSSNQTENSDILDKISGNEESQGTPAANTDQNKQVQGQQPGKTGTSTSSVATSQETDNSFIETAAKGDSKTTLARRALANYLEKNSDSTLTAEHKIYIEDYLRRRVANKGSVRIGNSVEFGKSLIQEAITKSKSLNDRQLKNLHKYALRVPSLS